MPFLTKKTCSFASSRRIILVHKKTKISDRQLNVTTTQCHVLSWQNDNFNFYFHSLRMPEVCLKKKQANRIYAMESFINLFVFARGQISGKHCWWTSKWKTSNLMHQHRQFKFMPHSCCSSKKYTKRKKNLEHKRWGDTSNSSNGSVRFHIDEIVEWNLCTDEFISIRRNARVVVCCRDFHLK